MDRPATERRLEHGSKLQIRDKASKLQEWKCQETTEISKGQVIVCRPVQATQEHQSATAEVIHHDSRPDTSQNRLVEKGSC
jgi:hypothetical protein